MANRKGTMSIKETADLIGASPLWVRLMCERGVLGEAIERRTRSTYIVHPQKVAEWLGISTEEVHKQMEEVRMQQDKTAEVFG